LDFPFRATTAPLCREKSELRSLIQRLLRVISIEKSGFWCAGVQRESLRVSATVGVSLGHALPVEAALEKEQQQKDIAILDRFNNAAVVKVVAAGWIDYLEEVKLDGQWKIINVLWELKPDTTKASPPTTKQVAARY